MSVLQDIPPQTESSQKQMLHPRASAGGWFVFLMLLGISGYLYLNLFLVTNVPILLSGDQVYFWMNGQRMLYGEHPYVDFFQFTPPGADVFYLFLFKLFGPRIWPINFAVLVLGVALCWVCFLIAQEILERHLALLSTLLFVTLIYTKLLNATHHYFSVLAIMGATAILIRGDSSRKLFIAGALLGIASFFTQTHGFVALAVVTFWLGWERYRTNDSWRSFGKKETILLSGFFLLLLILSAPFIARVGLRQLWYFQVTYVRKVMVHAPETHLLGMPEYANWRALPLLFVLGEYGRHFLVYALLPLTYLLVLVRCHRNGLSGNANFRKIAIVALVGSCLLGELIFSLNWLRLYAVSMAGIILFVWIISTSARFRRYALGSVWALVVLLGLSQPWFTQHSEYRIINLPAGKSAVAGNKFEKLEWGLTHTHVGDFFFEAPWPGMYIPLGVRNPVFLDTASTMLNPPWVEQAVQQLETKHVRYVMWAARLDYPVDANRPRSANIVPLRTYLHTRYRLAKAFQDGDEVWERNSQ